MRRLIMVLIVLLLVLPASGEVKDAPEGRKWIWVDVNLKRLTLYEGKRVLKSYPVATGTTENPTPLGIYYINSRFAGEMSGFGTRFLGLNVPWGQYGIHGTNKPESIGGNASHGCIRMRVKDAEELYAAVPNWTMVVIEGGPYGDLDTWLRPLQSGDRGSHVRAVQNRLRVLGYAVGRADG
ncbi:MAG: L,D-transpeptidase, partial [Clostridia bacterium]|nr:L,D-transpeptidase [Clostridia bacterium]